MDQWAQTRDLLAKPLSSLTAWGAPLAVLIAVQLAHGLIPYPAEVAVSAGGLAWMGAACFANAARCGRRHCFYSGPILLTAALAVVLIGVSALPVTTERIGAVVWAALALAALTFIPEWIWGRYRARRSRS